MSIATPSRSIALVRLALGALVCTALATSPTVTHAASLDDYMAQRGPEPTTTFHYGPGPFQVAEFFRPAGAAPFPVVILIHGGCWLNRLQGLPQFRALAGSLQAQGIAVWNIDYRGVDAPDGGYPGTYQDVAASLATLARQAGPLQLDLDRVVAIGHSAGAQLALWAAARPRIPSTSPLYSNAPMRIAHVVAVGALADLRGDSSFIAQTCGIDVSSLTGVPSTTRPDVFADTSPADMLPVDTDIALVNGDDDTIAPPALAKRFAAVGRGKGMNVSVVTIPDAGHFDEVDPGSPAWARIDAIVLRMLKMPAIRQ